MRITKFGHACIRIEHDGAVVVIDPGSFTAPEAVDGADAILITHEHADHVDPSHLDRSGAPIHTIAAVVDQLSDGHRERTTVVRPGQDLVVAGIPVSVVGQMHAVIHPDYPRFFNSGYVLRLGETTLYHPGDSLTVPPVQVDVCCVPSSGPWLKMAEAVDFARAVGAPSNLGIHDRLNSAVAADMVATHLNNLIGEGQRFESLEDGTDLVF
ncbi:MBL fold metallo-hydrolase [soil metagenome]